MALHEQAVGKTDEWYTPPYIFGLLGVGDTPHTAFDMDVASPSPPIGWIYAKQFLCCDSLHQPWHGFIWMNPPLGGRNGIVPWLEKFCDHGDGIALFPDRTSAPWWQEFAPRMGGILFVAPKIKFIDVRGYDGRSPAQGTCLGFMGARGYCAVRQAAHCGLGTLMWS